MSKRKPSSGYLWTRRSITLSLQDLPLIANISALCEQLKPRVIFLEPPRPQVSLSAAVHSTFESKGVKWPFLSCAEYRFHILRNEKLTNIQMKRVGRHNKLKCFVPRIDRKYAYLHSVETCSARRYLYLLFYRHSKEKNVVDVPPVLCEKVSKKKSQQDATLFYFSSIE